MINVIFGTAIDGDKKMLMS